MEVMCDSSTKNEGGDSINDRILEKLEALDQKVEKLLLLFSQNKISENSGGECCGTEVRITKFKRICNQSELFAFESKLNSDSYKAELRKFIESKFKNMEKYSKSYRRFAYDIIDTFCSRELYTEFSWLGKRSRDGKRNYSLQDNVIFINFIFAMIQIKMPSFKFGELEDIFTVLCRNKNSHNSKSTEQDAYTVVHDVRENDNVTVTSE